MTYILNRESPNTPYKKPMEKFAMSQKLSVVPGVSELISGLLKVKTRINTEAFLGDASEEFQRLAAEEIKYLDAAIAHISACTTDNARLKAEVKALREFVHHNHEFFAHIKSVMSASAQCVDEFGRIAAAIDRILCEPQQRVQATQDETN